MGATMVMTGFPLIIAEQTATAPSNGFRRQKQSAAIRLAIMDASNAPIFIETYIAAGSECGAFLSVIQMRAT